jgi:hypothetical protein
VQPSIGVFYMLIVFAVVGAAVAACGFVTLYEYGHRETMPAFFESWGGFELLIPILIACMVLSLLFPFLFFNDYAAQSFGVTEGVLSGLAAAAGVLGVAGIRALIRRRAAALRQRAGDAFRVVSGAEHPSARTLDDPDPRPLRPAGTRGRRLRKAA